MNNAAEFIRKRYVPPLREEEVELPMSDADFFSRLEPHLRKHILQPLISKGPLRVKMIDAFVTRLYDIYIRAIHYQNRVKVEQSPWFIRQYLHKYGDAKKELEKLLKTIDSIESSLDGPPKQDLAIGVLTFGPARVEISKLISTLLEIDCILAFAISPNHRTKKEEQLAANVRRERARMSTRKNSAELHRLVSTGIDKAVRRINRRKRISENQIEGFIVFFIRDFLKMKITLENVEITRRRLRS